ncbi:MAG: cation-translocating P-type ATPase [Methanomassiliicoccales archaeon]
MATPWHSFGKEGVLERLDVDHEGLSEGEVRRRLEEYGPNELTDEGGPSPLKILLDQFKDALIIILIIAAAVSAGIGMVQGTGEELIDATVIMVIVIANAILGFYQEHKAERTMQALRELAAPKATVIREGKEKEVDSRELVPGDIILLSTGDRISADARLLETFHMKVNEASLTGESIPLTKNEDKMLEEDAYIGERGNMVFSGCAVEYGRGRAVVTETGMSTALGEIASLIQTTPEQTHFQKKLDRLGRQIGIIVLIVSVSIFGVGMLRGVGPVDMFLTAVSLAVAAIPEGLAIVVTVSLALGLQRMARRNALLRRLPAVESLGSATVICTDKTGTLTKGEMNIREIYTGDREIRVSGEGFDPRGEFVLLDGAMDPLEVPELRWLLTAGTLCNDSSLVQEEGRWGIRGDTTEGTLLVTAKKAGLDDVSLREESPRVFEIPFDSSKKRMTTVNRLGEGRYAFTKGAAESVLPLCDRICLNGEIRDLDDFTREGLLGKGEEMAGRALRVLAVAMKRVEDEELSEESLEGGLIFLGLVGMIDAPRKEAIEAIKVSKRAGVKVKMITGDHALTARAIAQEMGIAEGEDFPVLTGRELQMMDDGELSRRVNEVNVFARVSPEHKLRIIDALKANGEIVAMTGDGVNDAPALKKADIGVAMGITGTDVSKEASDMILLDDDFASIVSATEEGRGIYENIQKFVGFLLSCNAGLVTTVFIATLIFVDQEFLPFLLPIQILWVNLVIESIPAVALGIERTEPEVMERGPRDPGESPITHLMVARVVVIGLLIAGVTLLAFQIQYWRDGDFLHARTVAFTTLVLMQMFYVFSMRSERKTLRSMGLFTNMKLIYAVLVSVSLQLAMVYLPFFNEVFRTTPLGLQEWLLVIPLALSAFVVNEAWKMYRGSRGAIT